MLCLFIHLVGPSSSLESSAFLSVSTGLSLIKNKIKKILTGKKLNKNRLCIAVELRMYRGEFF